MMGNFTPQAQELLDREQIRECIYRYARGVDRIDEELLRSAYWPDAMAHQLDFSGTRDEFVAWAIPSLRSMESSMHQVGNILIELRGNAAVSESYFHGLHAYAVQGVVRETVMGGRYLDRFEKRGGEWRILERHVVSDWFRDYPDASDWSAGPFGMRAIRGGRQPDDKSYALFGGAA